MLKDILLKTAEIINRDDLIDGLNNCNNSPSVKNDIIRLISYYNYTIETLTDNYFNLINKQTIQSSNNKQINFINFTYNPLKIISVTKNGKPVFFSVYSKYITVPEDNVIYEITYKYSSDKVKDIDEKVSLPNGITEKIVCYGIASEFLASKNKFEESEYWNNKFMFEIFKSKTSQDRKLKQTFVI